LRAHDDHPFFLHREHAGSQKLHQDPFCSDDLTASDCIKLLSTHKHVPVMTDLGKVRGTNGAGQRGAVRRSSTRSPPPTVQAMQQHHPSGTVPTRTSAAGVR
jgi:hypothetical protein